MVRWCQMGLVRTGVAFSLGVVIAACATAEPTTTTTTAPGPSAAESEEKHQDPPPVPNPPPRYAKYSDTNNAAPLPAADDGGLQIKCGGREPYVCMMEDGSFRCSDVPCVPSCDRVGCVGGDVCVACEGGFRCLGPGERC